MACSTATTRATRPSESSTPSRPNSGVSDPSSGRVATSRPPPCSRRALTMSAVNCSLIKALSGRPVVLGRLDGDRHPVLLQRPLGGRQHLDHAQPIPAIAQGSSAIANALEKVLAFEPDGLIDLQVRDRDIAEAEGDVFGKGAVLRVLPGTLVVHLQLLRALHVVGDDPLLAAADRDLPEHVRVV